MKAEKTLSERFNDAFRSLERTRAKRQKISDSERESLGKRFGAPPGYGTEPRDECVVIN